MTNQTQNFHDQEAVQCKHLDKLSMRHPQDEDPCLQEQSRQRQERPKLEINGQISEIIKIPRKKCTESKNKITKTAT